jgi:hypothetical protein
VGYVDKADCMPNFSPLPDGLKIGKEVIFPPSGIYYSQLFLSFLPLMFKIITLTSD